MSIDFNKYDTDFHKYYKYDPNSPSGLARSVPWKTGLNSQTTRGEVGSCVGRFNNRYWRTTLYGRSYMIHKVILSLFGITVPDGCEVDHINGNSHDNTFENLRVVSKSVNNRNRKKPSSNKTGYTGVSVRVDNIRCVTTYQACWEDFILGKQRSKSFPLTDQGFEDAIWYRHIMILKQNALGAGYSENHGS
jgi:hypothetical protein